GAGAQPLLAQLLRIREGGGELPLQLGDAGVEPLRGGGIVRRGLRARGVVGGPRKVRVGHGNFSSRNKCLIRTWGHARGFSRPRGASAEGRPTCGGGRAP